MTYPGFDAIASSGQPEAITPGLEGNDYPRYSLAGLFRLAALRD
jgi:hypothetical protein